LQWIGARRNAPITGRERLPGLSNYIIGNNPAQWRTGVPQYRQVRYSGIYRGIDVVYYGNQRQLEYDVVLSPGVDPGKIRLTASGTSGSAAPRGVMSARNGAWLRTYRHREIMTAMANPTGRSGGPARASGTCF